MPVCRTATSRCRRELRWKHAFVSSYRSRQESTRLRVKKKDYVAWTRTVLVSGSGIHLNAELEPETASPSPNVKNN